MIPMSIKQKIILKHRDGDSNRKIAEELGIDKNTVNKYVKEYEEWIRSMLAHDPEADLDVLPEYILEKPKYDTRNRKPKSSTLDAKEVIRECLEENKKKRLTGRSKQQMRKTDIHLFLIQKGYSISYSTVKLLVKALEEEEEQAKEAFLKQEYSPGQICEFDWGEVKLNIGDTGYHRYQMAVFTSAYGDYRYAKLYRTQDSASFQAAHTDFIRFCHGVYHTFVYDNMRVAVKKFVGPTEKEPTDALLQISAYYGFDFRFCNIRSGNEKGHVERSVDVIRHYAFSFPGDDVFKDLEAANIHLLKKCISKNQMPMSDGRIPKETFCEEKKHLMPEIPQMPCFIKKTGCQVNKYSTVCVNKVRYSVPDRYVGKKIDVRIYTDKILFYNDKTVIARHERFFDAGGYHIDIFHYLKTLKRKPGALHQSTALLQADTMIKNIYELYYTKEPQKFLEVLEIIKEIGPEKVMDALKELSVLSPYDLNAQKVRLICDKNNENCISVTGTDRLSEKSRETLKDYDILRDLQSRKAV